MQITEYLNNNFRTTNFLIKDLKSNRKIFIHILAIPLSINLQKNFMNKATIIDVDKENQI